MPIYSIKRGKTILEGLELRQCKNEYASVKNMFVLKLPPFFPHLHGKGKRAAISNLAWVSQKRIRSYIVLALNSYNARKLLNV